MGEARRRGRAARFRTGGAYIRRLAPADRAAFGKLTNGSNALGVLGVLWPMGLAVFATVRGFITEPNLPGLSRYRYQQVAPGWPNFTVPWPFAAALLVAAILMTVWMLRHPAVFKISWGATVWAWAGIAIGITCTAVMYLGAPGWPVWQIWLGIPAFVVAAVVFVYGRRMKNRR
ncbi:hypothetical protein [Frondihabitans australicus]|uniref:Uncharacterized protein n=1 Tax=Frondihabitans australicus TaxID=386892 RepID=A0A495IHZ7_9MICO|nr:hypothetical protein [Frondihabitans australicus]RKR74735.1 hypothetical protein C8E83_1864 [Frondihabitans australicus]